jgi:hypothetical protein
VHGRLKPLHRDTAAVQPNSETVQSFCRDIMEKEGVLALQLSSENLRVVCELASVKKP